MSLNDVINQLRRSLELCGECEEYLLLVQDRTDESHDLIAQALSGSAKSDVRQLLGRLTELRERAGELLVTLRQGEQHTRKYLEHLGSILASFQGPRLAPAAAATSTPGQPGGSGEPAAHPVPQRPRPDEIRLTERRRAHILDGEGNGVSGGHRSGSGVPGKTEFPREWTDDRIAHAVVDVARYPDQPPHHQANGRWLLRGTRGGVVMAVVVAPGGEIITAYPVSGPGVIRNPRR